MLLLIFCSKVDVEIYVYFPLDKSHEIKPFIVNYLVVSFLLEKTVINLYVDHKMIFMSWGNSVVSLSSHYSTTTPLWSIILLSL